MIKRMRVTILSNQQRTTDHEKQNLCLCFSQSWRPRALTRTRMHLLSMNLLFVDIALWTRGEPQALVSYSRSLTTTGVKPREPT